MYSSSSQYVGFVMVCSLYISWLTDGSIQSYGVFVQLLYCKWSSTFNLWLVNLWLVNLYLKMAVYHYITSNINGSLSLHTCSGMVNNVIELVVRLSVQLLSLSIMAIDLGISWMYNMSSIRVCYTNEWIFSTPCVCDWNVINFDKRLFNFHFIISNISASAITSHHQRIEFIFHNSYVILQVVSCTVTFWTEFGDISAADAKVTHTVLHCS